ncbi:hypothetical protein CBR_g74619 [Chara braunii]|uniref:Pectinesterase n=1 Tax=Chara braunii TaxID=69332 RepID=A0A388KA37_CHABU|nr:hypothetical protein CBR_g74619 [Chara braunii]|eukprot:GBG66932.1 hypothetical protein CBR_g74619 [Chara braunii]
MASWDRLGGVREIEGEDRAPQESGGGGGGGARGSGERKRGCSAAKWFLVSVGVVFVVVFLVAIPVAVTRARQSGRSKQNLQSAPLTVGAAANQTCKGSDDFQLCLNTLLYYSDGNSLNLSATADLKTLASFPIKVLTASSSKAKEVREDINQLVMSARGTVWEVAANECNASLYDSLPLLLQVANATKKEEYDIARAGLSALRTQTADCAEALFAALNLSVEVSSSADSFNATFDSVEWLFNGTAGATLYNSTVTFAFHLSNALNVITNVRDRIASGQVVVAGSRRRLMRRRLLAQADVDRSVTPDFTVDPSGGGNFKKIQQAVNAAVTMRAEKPDDRIVIKIKAGLYREKVFVPKELYMLTIIGEGPTRTKIQWGDYTNPNYTTGLKTSNTSTFAVEALGFLGIDFAIENDAGWSQKVQMAVASRASLRTLELSPGKLGSGVAAFVNCHFLGQQDTLYAHSGWQYYYRCLINGTVDYVFGNAAAVFQSCSLNSLRTNGTNTVTAQARTSKDEDTGFVFRHCDVDQRTTNQSVYLGQVHPYRQVYLGRPWKPYARVAYMFCYLGGINPEGWMRWTLVGKGADNHETAEFLEYRNTGPGSATEQRVSWSRVMSDDEAPDYTVEKFIKGKKWLPSLGIDSDIWA